ncbi:MAG: hypothetical protein OXI91_11645 [Chloroflexota bacterium]|nr:hypothetical protein [Chloroflexota bacterium]
MELLISAVGTLINILSFGRISQWSVRAYVVAIRYVHGEEERTIPTLHVEARNTGRYGITLHPLEYRIIQKDQFLKKYAVMPWKEHNEREGIQNPRLESGELAICRDPLPWVHPRSEAMKIEVIVKTHCGKRARRVARNHLRYYERFEIVTSDRSIEEYMRSTFPNYPV